MLAPFIGDRRTAAKLWRYYWDTIGACLPPAQIVARLETAGFRVHDAISMYAA